jgi:plastocyanin
MKALAGLFLTSTALAATVDGRVLRDGESVPYVALVLEGGEGQRVPGEARVDEVQQSFVPKVQVVAPGSRLVFHDRDDEAHGVHGWWAERTLFNRAVVPGEPGFAVTLDDPGVLALTCDLHSSMRAFVVVSNSPLSTVSATDGRFHFSDVPAGSYLLRAYHPERGHAMGIVTRALEIRGGATVITVDLPPRNVAVETPAPAAPAAPRHAPRLAAFMHGVDGWPHAQWAVTLLIAAALPIGFGFAALLLRWGARRGRSIEALFIGCAVAFMAGALVVVGLNGAVATALGFGVFTGSVLFGAWRWHTPA